MPDKITITAPNGTDAEMGRVKQLRNDGICLDAELLAEDEGWRVDMTVSTKNFDLVTSWREGNHADLEGPDWFKDVLGIHRQKAA